MKVNKVVLQNVDIESTVLDLSADTVSPEKVLKDEVFHMANGESAEGSLIEVSNISFYKFQDKQRIGETGGELATDEEYLAAENYMQILYKKIMEDKDE